MEKSGWAARQDEALLASGAWSVAVFEPSEPEYRDGAALPAVQRVGPLGSDGFLGDAAQWVRRVSARAR
jgi:hypothetical protein